MVKSILVGVDTNAANLLTYFPSLPVGITTTACVNSLWALGGVFDAIQGSASADEFGD